MEKILEKTVRPYVGRLAPSPTGALHLGNVRTFMLAWLRARSRGGRVIMRMEDLDHPRDRPGAAEAALEDLRWLGFDWDEEYIQSQRRLIYREQLLRLHDRIYPCVCSRRDVENAQSAPHAGEQLRYPGICRGRFPDWNAAVAAKGSAPVWRFRVPEGRIVAFDDVFCGHFEQNVAAVLGDFPLARDPDGAGYTFAATVDDWLMGVTEVVRGDDLLAATPAQILLAEALGAPIPAYCHVPLVVGADGKRLAKRHGDTRVAAFRAAGWSAERLLGVVAASCNLCNADECVKLSELVADFALERVPHERWIVRNID